MRHPRNTSMNHREAAIKTVAHPRGPVTQGCHTVKSRPGTCTILYSMCIEGCLAIRWVLCAIMTYCRSVVKWCRPDHMHLEQDFSPYYDRNIPCWLPLRYSYCSIDTFCHPFFLRCWEGNMMLSSIAQNILAGHDRLESPQRIVLPGQIVLNSLHHVMMANTSDSGKRDMHWGGQYSAETNINSNTYWAGRSEACDGERYWKDFNHASHIRKVLGDMSQSQGPLQVRSTCTINATLQILLTLHYQIPPYLSLTLYNRFALNAWLSVWIEGISDIVDCPATEPSACKLVAAPNCSIMGNLTLVLPMKTWYKE